MAPRRSGDSRNAAIGLRARTARAIAVVVADGEDGLAVLDRRELATWDPGHPDSRQPHHAGLDVPAKDAHSRVAAAETAVRRAAHASLRELVQALRERGIEPTGVAVVGAPEKDPSRIGNLHVRAHAAEGQLFRSALEEAAEAEGLRWIRLTDRDAFDEAAERLHCSVKALRKQTADLGREIGPPWRADEKLACLGALLLVGREPGA